MSTKSFSRVKRMGEGYGTPTSQANAVASELFRMGLSRDKAAAPTVSRTTYNRASLLIYVWPDTPFGEAVFLITGPSFEPKVLLEKQVPKAGQIGVFVKAVADKAKVRVIEYTERKKAKKKVQAEKEKTRKTAAASAKSGAEQASSAKDAAKKAKETAKEAEKTSKKARSRSAKKGAADTAKKAADTAKKAADTAKQSASGASRVAAASKDPTARKAAAAAQRAAAAAQKEAAEAMAIARKCMQECGKPARKAGSGSARTSFGPTRPIQQMRDAEAMALYEATFGSGGDVSIAQVEQVRAVKADAKKTKKTSNDRVRKYRAKVNAWASDNGIDGSFEVKRKAYVANNRKAKAEDKAAVKASNAAVEADKVIASAEKTEKKIVAAIKRKFGAGRAIQVPFKGRKGKALFKRARGSHKGSLYVPKPTPRKPKVSQADANAAAAKALAADLSAMFA